MSAINGRKYDLDVLLTIDRNFVLGCGTLMISILEHNPDLTLLFHIVTGREDVGTVSKELSVRFSGRSNCELRFYVFDQFPLFRRLEAGGLSTRKVVQCVRLIAPSGIETNADRLLYLDSDIVCMGSISELVQLDLGGRMFAATRWREDGSEEILDGKFRVVDTICSGVVLFNLRKWLDTVVDQDLVDFVVHEQPKYVDQTALNVVCAGDILFLPSWFDSFNFFDNKTVFVHYVAENPWEPWCYGKRGAMLEPFRHYARLFEPNVSRWITFRRNRESLVNFNSDRNPASRYATKWMARKMLSRGCIGAAFYFLCMHLYYKIMNKGILGLLLLKSNSE